MITERKRRTPEDYSNLAESRGFKWLGPKVKNVMIKTMWKCSKGHRWETKYNTIQGGCGCPYCYLKTPQDYHELAESRGFKWLGPKVKRTNIKTTWQCSKGHQWQANYDNIHTGTNCPFCTIKARKLPEEYRKLAESRGFEWLGPEVKRSDIKTAWKCKQGHQWKTRYNSILQGQGCPYCSGKIRKTPQDYHQLARSRGFEWLGPEVESTIHKTTWRCSKGHQWKAKYNTILNGNGCGHCHEDRLRLPEDYHELAKNRGFKWLGPEVKGVTIKTTWQCRKGHRWEAVYSSIQQGSGCPVCFESRGEKKITKILQSYNIYFTKQKKFEECKNIRHLPFDFYFQIRDKYFLIEYHGEQHYEPIGVFGGEEALVHRQQNDRIKADFAKEHGFILIVIPYTEYNNIQTILREAIETHTGKSINEITRIERGAQLQDFNPYLYTQATFN